MNSRSMRVLVGVSLIMCIAVSVWAAGDREQEVYPSRPITVIVPWAPGGNTDMTARALVSVMGKYLPQPLIVVNKPGGGSVVGFTEALQERPDGYTIIVTGHATVAAQPHMQQVTYGRDDYQVVMQLGYVPRIIVARPDAPYNSMSEMMDYARRQPGQVVVGISAVGTTGHYAMAGIELDYGVQFNMIPQGGGGPQRAAIIGGHVDIGPPLVTESGALDGLAKPLAMLSPSRFDMLPNVPTAAEEGYPAEGSVATHLYVRAGTPEERVKILYNAFKQALEDEAFFAISNRLALGAQYMSGEESSRWIAEQYETYGRVAEALGFK